LNDRRGQKEQYNLSQKTKKFFQMKRKNSFAATKPKQI
jgi:hypothetical protein